MDTNGILQKHWVTVAARFALDALIFALAFVLGTYLRLGEAQDKLKDPKAAREAYAKYLELAPEDKEAKDIKKRVAKL